MTFKAALIQMRSGTKPARNIETLESAVAEAVAKGASYVQTPEMTGAIQRNRAELASILASEESDPVVAAASRLSAKHGVHLHIGSTAIALEEGRIANRAFLFGPDGALITTYDKLHMFDVDLDNGESWRESAVYRPGDRAVVADLPFGRLGLGICYDIRFPHLFRDQAVAGADLLTAPAAFTRQTGEAHWHVLQRARAIENGAFVLSAAQGGVHEDGRETYGHSIVIDPWGRVIAEATGADPQIVYADIDIGEVAKARAKVPNLRNAQEYQLETIEPAEKARQRA